MDDITIQQQGVILLAGWLVRCLLLWNGKPAWIASLSQKFSNIWVRVNFLNVFCMTEAWPFFFFIFTLWSAKTAKSTLQQVLFLTMIITRSALPVGIRWSVCISKSQRIFSSHSLGGILACAYTIFFLYGQISISCTIPNGSPSTQSFLLSFYSSWVFSRALAGGFSLESEWQQVFSDLQDFYQYPNRFL